MCHSCSPGLHLLAQAVLQGLDLSKLPPPSEPSKTLGFSEDATIFTGCKILTMAGGKFSPVDALAISHGKVMSAGTLKEAIKLAGPHHTTINLPKDHCILPGFIDNHVHILHAALIENFYMDVGTTVAPTQQKALDLLKNRASETPDEEWVTAFGYDPALVDGHYELDKKILDTCSTVHPILVVNQNQHVAYVNSKALECGSIDPHITDPQYMKDENGELTGVILETAVTYFARLAPQPDGAAFASWVKRTLNNWAKSGCTSVFDAAIGIIAGTRDFTMLKTFTAGYNPPLRLVGALYDRAIPDVADILAPPPVFVGTTKVSSIKFITDGSTQGLTAAVRRPYLKYADNPDDPHSRGNLNYDTNSLQASMSYYLKKGWQLVVHCNGDRASEQVLDIFEAIFKEIPDRDTSIMHRIEHFTVTSKDQVAKAQRLGLGVDHTMSHVWNWGQAFEDYVLGKERGSRIDPVGDDVKCGLTFAFNSDAPLVPVNPLKDVQGAVTRQVIRDGKPGKVIGKDQRVPLEVALRGITTNAAKLLMMEDTVGSLEVGKSADLAILDQDPRAVDDLNKIKVLETWLQGSRVCHRE